jgi:hypothetical protein
VLNFNREWFDIAPDISKYQYMQDKNTIAEFEINNIELLNLLNEWEPKLRSLSDEIISSRKNIQNRSIKQIVGHMVDSATNNTHRIIHLQYQQPPVQYPDYANLGNNDRWIAIQNYQDENWQDLVQLWKYTNLHIVHVIRNVDLKKIENVWTSALNQTVSMKAMIIDYLRHFKLHLDEINLLIEQADKS